MKKEVVNKDDLFQLITKFEVPTELKRRYDLAVILIDNPNRYDEYELADFLNVSVTTIRRDFNYFRSLGLCCHSRKRCVEIVNIKKLLRPKQLEEYQIIKN